MPNSLTASFLYRRCYWAKTLQKMSIAARHRSYSHISQSLTALYSIPKLSKRNTGRSTCCEMVSDTVLLLE